MLDALAAFAVFQHLHGNVGKFFSIAISKFTTTSICLIQDLATSAATPLLAARPSESCGQ